jgi:putative flippase GtrA
VTTVEQPQVNVVRRINLGARKPQNWMQLLKFGSVGASGYVINLAVFALLVHFADLHHMAAAVGAFVVAVSNNFWWNRHWTFAAGAGHAGWPAEPARAKPSRAAVEALYFQAARFFVVSLVGLAINLVLLELFISSFDLPELAAQALAVALVTPVNFIGNKLWTFEDSNA